MKAQLIEAAEVLLVGVIFAMFLYAAVAGLGG